MESKAQKIFYGLSIFLFMMTLFIMQPSQISATDSLQSQMKSQLVRAWQEIIGDQPYFDNFSLIYDGVNSFYNQATVASISMIQRSDSDQDLAYVFKTMYLNLVMAFTGNRPIALASPIGSGGQALSESAPVEQFMTQAAIYNIMPDYAEASSGEPEESLVSSNQYPVTGQVAGISVQLGEPVNNVRQPWVTIQDNFTGQLYCLAVYNSEVNKYLGECKDDTRRN